MCIRDRARRGRLTRELAFYFKNVTTWGPSTLNDIKDGVSGADVVGFAETHSEDSRAIVDAMDKH
eukprot:10269-Pyramimonas_sp.AAC.1